MNDHTDWQGDDTFKMWIEVFAGFAICAVLGIATHVAVAVCG